MNKLGIALASLSLVISTGAQAVSATRSAQALPAASKVAPGAVASRTSQAAGGESEFVGIPALPFALLIAILAGFTFVIVDEEDEDNDSPG